MFSQPSSLESASHLLRIQREWTHHSFHPDSRHHTATVEMISDFYTKRKSDWSRIQRRTDQRISGLSCHWIFGDLPRLYTALLWTFSPYPVPRHEVKMKNEEQRHDANKSGCNGQIMISSSGERYQRMLWSTARLERVKKLTSPILKGLLNYFPILCFHSLCN